MNAEHVLHNFIIYTVQQLHVPYVAIVQPDGSCQRLLTAGNVAYAAPAISPDGHHIAVARNSGSGWDGIWLMNANGSGLTKLVGHSTFDGSPAWSPSGTQIAFRSENPGPFGPYGRIYLVNVDGTGLHQLSPETTDYTYDDEPAWSPDGQRIAFTRNGRLEVINVDGTGLTELAQNGEYPAWSPNGAQLAYDAFIGGTSYSIVVANADGSNPTVVNTDTTQEEEPRWSPDGQQLVFERLVFYPTVGNVFQLFTMHADGSGVTRLSKPSPTASEGEPSWSPLP
ncbi:MAG TPA: hypothetical protein VGV12_12095 [Gemmatimonadales bacterium]|nr:hypothetical protein [Gemmatimonadales bacterium]